MGTLERLQKSVLEYLSGIGDLKFADLSAENSDKVSEAKKGEGLSVEILEPIPLAASKYAAGPTFSEVELSLRVRRNFLSPRAPSMLTACEIISRALHNWNPPLSCGYGKVTLAQNSPWVRDDSRENSKQITIKFTVQSVLS